MSKKINQPSKQRNLRINESKSNAMNQILKSFDLGSDQFSIYNSVFFQKFQSFEIYS